MAQTENGVGVSYKLADGTMVWARRDSWAEVTEDIKVIFGEEALERLTEQIVRAWGGNKPPAPALKAVQVYPESEGADQVLTPEEVEASMTAGDEAPSMSYQTCPRCGGLKDRWVPAGTSKKPPFKSYPGFFGCSTPRCPGR